MAGFMATFGFGIPSGVDESEMTQARTGEDARPSTS